MNAELTPVRPKGGLGAEMPSSSKTTRPRKGGTGDLDSNRALRLSNFLSKEKGLCGRCIDAMMDMEFGHVHQYGQSCTILRQIRLSYRPLTHPIVPD
jgi:hypothetical protein